MSIEEKAEEMLERAKDYAGVKAAELNAKADEKADSWVTAGAKWLVASRFTWAILGGAAGVAVVLLVL